MKIAVTSDGPTLDDRVGAVFSRCEYYLIVETDDLSFEVLQNPFVFAETCQGIGAARLVVGKGAKAVLTTTSKPAGYLALQTANVELFMGVTGTVEEAVERYKAGEFSPMTKEQELEYMKGFSEYFEETLEGIRKLTQQAK